MDNLQTTTQQIDEDTDLDNINNDTDTSTELQYAHIKINKLLNQLLDKEIELKNAQIKINELETQLLDKEKIINKSVNIGKDFVNKLICIISLRKTFKQLLGINFIISGSFIRQIFELPVALSESFITSGYGNPIGHDIDIFLTEFQNIKLIEKIREKIKEMNNFIKYNKLSPSVFPPIKFGEYELIEITDSTLKEMSPNEMMGKIKLLNIPHYIFKLKDDNNNLITIDILGWKPESDILWPNTDFNVNSLFLTNTGIISNDFDDILYNIINKEAKCLINLKILHDALIEVKPKSEKRNRLNQIIYFLTNRIKIIGVGYNIWGNNIPDIFIEYNESCLISELSPPFLSINLLCNHNISIMTFIGIINEINDFTEAISCPFCRKSILMKFKNISAKEILFWTPNKIEVKNEPINVTVPKLDEKQIFSNESKEFIQIKLKNTHEEHNYEPRRMPQVRPGNITHINDEIPRTLSRINNTKNSISTTFDS
jgi:hypothetical protein